MRHSCGGLSKITAWPRSTTLFHRTGGRTRNLFGSFAHGDGRSGAVCLTLSNAPLREKSMSCPSVSVTVLTVQRRPKNSLDEGFLLWAKFLLQRQSLASHVSEVKPVHGGSYASALRDVLGKSPRGPKLLCGPSSLRSTHACRGCSRFHYVHGKY